MAAAQAVIREIEIDPFAILPHDMEIYGIFEYKSTVPHVGTSSGFTVAACCSYPPVIQSLNQANRPVNLSGRSGWREKCGSAALSINP